jgi:GGDEF domain-containing protein
LILRGKDANEYDARAIALRLWEQIRRTLDHKGETLRPSASIGVALAGDGATRSAELLEAADRDMYRNKQSVRGRIAA